jgi:aspartate aminotransferase
MVLAKIEKPSGVVDYISKSVRTQRPYGIRLLDPFEQEAVSNSITRIDQNINRLSGSDREIALKLRAQIREINPNLDYLDPVQRAQAFNFGEILVRQGYIKASIGDTVVPGHPIFKTNEKFLDFIIEAFREGKTGYSGSTGTPDFKKAVADYTGFRFGFKAAAADVLIGRGATDPIEKVAQALMQDSYGIAGAPFYPPYESTTHHAGGKISTIITKKDNDFKLTGADIENRIKHLIKRAVPKEKIKVLWLTHPNNPTGSFYSESELKDIAKVAKKHNLTVVADEVYGGTVTKGKYLSMLKVWESLPKKDRFTMVHLGGFSKDPLFWFTGSRIGWAVIPGADKYSRALKTAINAKLAPPHLNPPTLEEAAGTKLINYYLANPGEFKKHTSEAIRVLDHKNTLLHEVISRIPQVQRAGGYRKPAAAFYHFVPIDVSLTALNSGRNPDLKFAKMLQAKFRTRITHGNAFSYPSGIRDGTKRIIHQRIVSLLPDDLIHELGRRLSFALDRMEYRHQRSLKK